MHTQWRIRQLEVDRACGTAMQLWASGYPAHGPRSTLFSRVALLQALQDAQGEVAVQPDSDAEAV